MANPRPDEMPSEPREERSAAQTSARENIRSISEAGSKIAGSAADMSQRAAQTSVEMLNRNKKMAQQLWECSTELVAHVGRQYADQMGRVFGISWENAEKVGRKSSKNFETLMQSGDVITSASRDLSREWFDTMRRMIDTTVGRSERLMTCRTPSDLFAIQLELMRDSVEAALHGAKRLSEISAEAAEEATEKMSEAARHAA